ncbi:hypothetical protein CEXT_720471 [Caerostris extrusa]|uniref:Uncharacterized protein n=1 Tax=Caerostris extrusa TaxID=172846 RepID=A0AAV4UXT4_CAEEX|nr:hypothetical protein CEXT_720471 [Caerostris extrusa]
MYYLLQTLSFKIPLEEILLPRTKLLGVREVSRRSGKTLFVSRHTNQRKPPPANSQRLFFALSFPLSGLFAPFLAVYCLHFCIVNSMERIRQTHIHFAPLQTQIEYGYFF